MKKALRLIILLSLIALVTGCASTGAYFVDRGRDVADVFTATVGTGIGAKVRIGPIQPALVMNSDVAGLRSGQLFASWEATQESFGPFGFMESAGLAPTPNFGVEIEAHDRFNENGRGKSIYAYSPFPFVTRGSHAAYYTQIEAVIALGPSVRLGFNPGELLDFLLGWFGVDIYRDDIGRIEQAKLKSSERELLAMIEKIHPSFQAAGITWRGYFGFGRKEEYTLYCLWGGPYFRMAQSKDFDSVAQNWAKKYPDAKAVPVHVIKQDGSSPEIMYVWIKDEKDCLNIELVRKGCCKARAMFPPSLELLVPKKEFDEFIEEVWGAERIAKEGKLGVWMEEK